MADEEAVPVSRGGQELGPRLVAPLVPAGGTSSWLQWWVTTRNRLIISPWFQRWAVRAPVARAVARWRAGALFDMVAGFVYSQVLLAGVQLKLFEAVAERPLSADELMARMGLPRDGALRLLDAATSLKLLQQLPGGRYALGIHGASLVGNPSVSRMIEHHAMLYRDLSDPVAMLRGEMKDAELKRYWSYAAGGPAGDSSDDAVAPYSALMASSMALLADDLLDAYPLEGHRHLMDLAGGEGAFVEAAARRTAGLSLTLFDLPPVARRARARLEAAGLGDRVTVVGGDLFRDEPPAGADVVSLVRVVHDHDDAQALRILQAARKALPAGGTLLIAEPMSGTSGAEAMGDAYFGFYLMAMGQGRPRTPDEVRQLALRAGFREAQLSRTRRPMLTRLMVARA